MPYIMLLDADYGGGGPVLHIGGSSTTGTLGKGDDGGDQTTKSQARRAQVRKAQIQHRQRKANYTKQLEADVARLRGDIARTESESAALRGENNAIRQRLAEAGVVAPLRLKPKQTFQLQPTLTTTGETDPIAAEASSLTNPQPLTSALVASSSSSSDYYTVSLDMSETNTPAYQVYRTVSPSLQGSHGVQSPIGGNTTPSGSPWGGGSAGATPVNGSELTDEQADYAINFILAYVVSSCFISPLKLRHPVTYCGL